MPLPPSGKSPEVEPDPRLVAEQLELLTREQRVRPAWVAVLVASFVLSGLGMVLWAHHVGRALRRRRRPEKRTRFRWGVGMTLVGIALWLLSVWRA